MRRLRDLIEMVEAEGLKVCASSVKGTHIRLRCARPNGEQADFITATTPSDHRSMLNFRATIRRFARGLLDPVRKRSHQE